ncbi:MAG: dihydrodipicolinate synthase family protein, partial [Actinomycetota bacterium]|nr:dihydrodipicolinate synthase family protein [Actinomycetota bacterium]
MPGRDELLVIPEPGWAATYPPPACRRVFAAAHAAARPRTFGPAEAGGRGDSEADIDWEATIGFRDHLWAHGFGVAEAMDTSQRGMGLSWAQARELIARSAARAAERRAAGSAAALACG